MSSWIKSGFSEPITMESISFWDPEARSLRIRVIRGCTRGTANFQNLVPMPRNIREATSSRTRVPAPTVIIMALMIDYRKRVEYDGCRRLTKDWFKTRCTIIGPIYSPCHA
jgi:hypothetical protein